MTLVFLGFGIDLKQRFGNYCEDWDLELLFKYRVEWVVKHWEVTHNLRIPFSPWVNVYLKLGDTPTASRSAASSTRFANPPASTSDCFLFLSIFPSHIHKLTLLTNWSLKRLNTSSHAIVQPCTLIFINFLSDYCFLCFILISIKRRMVLVFYNLQKSIMCPTQNNILNFTIILWFI